MDTLTMRSEVSVILAGVEEKLDDLQQGDMGPVLRNDPVFMLVVDEVARAGRLLDG